MCPNGKIGPALNITTMYGETCKPEDAIAAHNWETIRGWSFLDLAVWGRYNKLAWSYLVDRNIEPVILDGDMEIMNKVKPDFIAINYYSTVTIAASKGDTSDISARAGDQQIMLGEQGVYRAAENPYVDKTKYGWVIDPIGLRMTLRKVCERYNLPILITENGIGAPDELEENDSINDYYRIDYIGKHLNELKLAIADGVEVIGYCPWSVIDVVSTHQGYGKRYGFIYVNRDEFDLKDLRRIKKKSFDWYKGVINTNGKEL
jgi:6-phospho-beta-glucosidase